MYAHRRAPGDASAELRSPPCPRCHGPLLRVRRRLLDRVVSLFAPLRRYRCDNFACRWEGTLRTRRSDPGAAPPRRPSER